MRKIIKMKKIIMKYLQRVLEVMIMIIMISKFFKQFFQYNRDWRDLGHARLCAFGPLTAIELEKLKLRVDAIPSEHQGPPILEVLAPFGGANGRRILLARPLVVVPDIPDCLREAGAIVDDLPVHECVVDDEDRSSPRPAPWCRCKSCTADAGT